MEEVTENSLKRAVSGAPAKPVTACEAGVPVQADGMLRWKIRVGQVDGFPGNPAAVTYLTEGFFQVLHARQSVALIEGHRVCTCLVLPEGQLVDGSGVEEAGVFEDAVLDQVEGADAAVTDFAMPMRQFDVVFGISIRVRVRDGKWAEHGAVDEVVCKPAFDVQAVGEGQPGGVVRDAGDDGTGFAEGAFLILDGCSEFTHESGEDVGTMLKPAGIVFGTGRIDAPRIFAIRFDVGPDKGVVVEQNGHLAAEVQDKGVHADALDLEQNVQAFLPDLLDGVTEFVGDFVAPDAALPVVRVFQGQSGRDAGVVGATVMPVHAQAAQQRDLPHPAVG